MASDSLPKDIQKDIDAVGKIPIIDSLLEVVCRTTGMGFAAVARVTETKWIACTLRDEISFGLKPGGELELKTTICDEIRQNRQAVIIDHVAEDKNFCGHHTPAMYGFQSYISVPIILKNGEFFGTLCAIDPRPAQLNNPQITGMFFLFAELISFHLNAIDELALSEARILEQQKIAELREQFIAILGHDLRNPVGSIMMAAELLSVSDVAEENLHIIKTIKNSSYRISGLIENILDFARGRLGSGISLDRKETRVLDKTLLQIIEELHTIWPEHIIETEINLAEPVNCDLDRLAQLFSNLLGNAIIHGIPGTAVKVKAFSDKEKFELSICNAGKPIPEADQQKLFQPFYRGEDKSGKKGLGLGLYIASEIAKAHAGTITVESDENQTCFTLVIPV